MISCLKSPSNEWVQEFIWRTELRVNWSQPWCPLHAPKLLWSRLKKAKVGRKPDPSRPEWDGTGLSVLFEKRMLHLWLVALCVHVVMWSSIRPSSHRYHGEALLHMFSVSLSRQWIWTSWFPIWDTWSMILCGLFLWWFFLLFWFTSFSTQAITGSDQDGSWINYLYCLRYFNLHSLLLFIHNHETKKSRCAEYQCRTVP